MPHNCVQFTYLRDFAQEGPFSGIVEVVSVAEILQKLLHRPGIEPGPPAWQASILPLNQRCSVNVI